MKKNIFLLALAATTLLTACSTSTVEEEKVAVKETLKADTKKSTLSWKGGKSEEDFHTGMVSLKEGSVEMLDGVPMSGQFEIDMTSIVATDAELPDPKKEYLASHLMNEDFFDVERFPVAKVTTGELKNGIWPITVELMGKKVSSEVAVKTTTTEGATHISGKFDMNFSELATPGFEVDPETGEGIAKTFSFDLNLHLTK